MQKRDRRRFNFKGVLLIAMLMLGVAAISKNTYAASKTVYTSGSYEGKSVISGNYVVYNSGTQIVKYDTKTKKSKVLVNKVMDSECVNMTIYNGYLFWAAPTVDNCIPLDYYIFKVSLDGKNYKKLTRGNSFAIYGNKIYYHATGKYDVSAGIYRMSVNAAEKKCIVKSNAKKWDSFKIKSVDGKYIYAFSSAVTTKTDAANSDEKIQISNGKRTAVTGKNHMSLIGVDSKYTVYQNSKNVVVTTNKTKKDKILINTKSYTSVLYRGGYIYYTVGNSSKTVFTIYKMNVANKKKTVIIKNIKNKNVTITGVDSKYLTYSILASTKTYNKKAAQKAAVVLKNASSGKKTFSFGFELKN